MNEIVMFDVNHWIIAGGNFSFFKKYEFNQCLKKLKNLDSKVNIKIVKKIISEKSY